jgi:hypothetical protein
MLKFRNLDVSPSDPVEKWGVEDILHNQKALFLIKKTLTCSCRYVILLM